MITDEIRRRMLEAMKRRDDVEKGILRVALGEVQSLATTKGRPLDDAEVVAVLRKLVKADEETLSAGARPDQRDVLQREIAILQGLLPRTLSEEDVVRALEGVREAVLAAKNDGQATGVALKHLKAAGHAVTGDVVAAAVRRMRA
jgi:hypothetical protein